MYKKVIVGIILGLAVVIAFALFLKTHQVSPLLPVAKGAPLTAWVAVQQKGVSQIDSDTKAVVRAMDSGDEVKQGMTISTDVTGLATIYFPDGSAARMDSNTILTITEAGFKEDKNSLAVSLRLEVGRVWSKIFELATPDSHWEVKTSNAVATVRGTAFGVQSQAGASTILGSEHTVKVWAIDPTTGQKIGDTDVAVQQDNLLVLNQSGIEAMKAGKQTLSRMMQITPESMMQQGWVQRFRKADVEDNKVIDGFRQESDGDVSLFRRAMLNWMKEKRTEWKNNTQPEETTVTPPPSNTPTTTTTTPPLTKPPVAAVLPVVIKPRALSIESPGTNIDPTAEYLYYKAFVSFEDGSRKEVTGSTNWQVIGGVGRFSSPGVFIPNTLIIESGTAYGTVTASWKDPASGVTVSAQSPVQITIRPQ